MGRVELTAAELPRYTDVVVVGAGLATAFFAAEAGLGRVVVLERRDALAGLTSAHSAEGFRLEWDAPENVAMVRESIDIFAHFAEVVRLPGFDVGLRQQGYLFLASPTPGATRQARLRERVAWWRQHGLEDVEYLDAAEARRRFPFVRPEVEEGTSGPGMASSRPGPSRAASR